MQELTIKELTKELERWPELGHYKIKVGPYQLIQDEAGNIFSHIAGNTQIVFLKAEKKE